MPQFSPLWFLNTLSWAFVLLSFLVFYLQSISFTNLLNCQLSRLLMLCE